MVSLKAIEKAKNITILTDDDSFGDASALYTYILRLHKKVSLVSPERELHKKISCIPWFEKVKKTVNASSDLSIDLRKNQGSLYELFQVNSVSINEKMATALYASYLQKPECYTQKKNIFALAELLRLKANHEVCMRGLKKNLPLSLFRLKAILFARLVLHENAQVAIISLEEEDFQKTGATMYDLDVIMQEVLNIAHVQRVVVVDAENENKLVRII